MKKGSMKIPPLGQLYEQKIDFSAHKKKLQQIKSDRKTALLRQGEHQSILRRNVHHHSLKFNAKSLEIARQNSKIIRKIQSIKPSYDFGRSVPYGQKLPRTLPSHSHSRIAEQQRENYRLRQRVQSMNSSLNSKKMLDDYRRSMQIRRRITHFKTEENRVILKAERYFGGGRSASHSQQVFKKLLQDPSQRLFDNPGCELLQKKLNRNPALHYKKEDIIKNKVKINAKLFKSARQKRLKAILALEKNPAIQNKNEKLPTFFPTQPQRNK